MTSEEWINSKSGDPSKMLYGVNEYGTLVSLLTCSGCGRNYTVCPALSTDEWESKWGTGCLAVECPSYDPSRDIDALWDVHVDLGLIVTEPVEQT